MYERHFGLNERPFDLTPNPHYLFLTSQHREALSNIRHGIAQRMGVTLVLGPAGTGKTTLIRAALASFAGTGLRYVLLSNPALTRDELLRTLAHGFELSEAASQSKALLLVELERRLRERHADNEVTVLIVDEAQALSMELLEEVRLLVNIETDTEKLLPVVLVGQPELADRLNEPSCRALKQRVALRCELGPLTLTETAEYITARVKYAGGVAGQLFTREAVGLIYQRSGGIPRVISVICDNALMSGFALGQRPVGSNVVLEVCTDFDLAETLTSANGGTAASAKSPGVVPFKRPEEDPDSTERRTRPDSPLFGMFEGPKRSWLSRRGATR